MLRESRSVSSVLPGLKRETSVMRRTFLSLVLAAVLSACASTATEDAAESDDLATVVSETEKPKMRCYREPNTGFRLGGRRVCKPVGE